MEEPKKYYLGQKKNTFKNQLIVMQTKKSSRCNGEKMGRKKCSQSMERKKPGVRVKSKI